MPDLSLLPPSAVIDGDDLRIAGCLLTDVADRFGTPAFVIDTEALQARAQEYISALASSHGRGRVCFAVKAYPAVSVIRVLVQAGLGCDVVGAGELRLALAAGADPATIVMHGNAKSDEDIIAALEAGIGYIAVDGFDDIDRIGRFARRRTPVLLRVSPGVDSGTHAALATGGVRSKFGVPIDQVPGAIARMRATGVIDLRGLHAHIGSQIATLEAFEAAVAALASLDRFDVYDFGGGLAVRYVPADTAPMVGEYVGRLVAAAHRQLGTDIEILIEPGRSMVARAGVTLYRVQTIKRAGGRGVATAGGTLLHVAVDGGMGDNLEPSLYGQRFDPFVLGRWEGEPVRANLVGRHCEEGDVITPGIMLTQPRIGDLVVVPVTGAYCFTMANNYNAAPRPPVIFCDNGTARIAIRRESFADLIAREVDA
jgi:diaminopimelate decarboxylase